jgi:hypothetical protein
VEFTVLQGEELLRVELGLDTPVRLEPSLFSKYGVQVNGYQDLCVDKLLAYFGRAESRDAADLYFILQQESLDELLDLAAREGAGSDLYWLAVAFNQVVDFPDELERWPVEMLSRFEPMVLKEMFRGLATELISGVTGSGDTVRLS